MGSNYDDWTVQELKEALKERGLLGIFTTYQN